MNYAELRDPDGKAYKCTICNVVAVLDETVVESVEIKSFEQGLINSCSASHSRASRSS